MRSASPMSAPVVVAIAALTILLATSTASGQLVYEIDATVPQHGATPNSTTAYPFSHASVAMMWWHPDAFPVTPVPGMITEFGLQFVQPVNTTWNDVEIFLGESSHFGPGSANGTFDANADVTAFTLVHSGNLSVHTTTADEHWRVTLSTPFFWDPSNTLVALVRMHTPSLAVNNRCFFSPGIPNCGRSLNFNSSTATTADFHPTGQDLTYGVSIAMRSEDLYVDTFGPTTTTMIDSDSTGPTGDGEMLIEFEVSAPGEDWTVTSLEFTVQGSGDGATAFSQLGLYEDDGNDTWDGAAIDLLATASAGTAFSAPNGTYTATLSDPDFPLGTTRRFYLVGLLSGSASAGDRFEVALTSVSATSAGAGIVSGVPTGYSAGIEINAARLMVTNNGPFTPQPVPFDAAGPHGDGVLMLAMTIGAHNHDFVIDSLDLRAFGTGDDAAHFAEVAVYQDSGSGIWDGAAIDTQLAATTAFPADNGVWTAALPGFSVSRSTTKRLYVVATLNGEAPNGSTFGVTLDAINVSAPAAFQLIGVPFGASVAIDVQTPLTVSSFEPLASPSTGGMPITIRGTGFTLPVILTIGDEVADGEAEVNSNGTEILGLLTPAGFGRDLEISLTCGTETIVLSQRFEYRALSTADSGCAAAGSASVAWPLLAAFALIALAARRRVGCRRNAFRMPHALS